MSKQTKTYVLLVLVLAIWGTLGYQIYTGLSSDPEIEVSQEVARIRPLKVEKPEPFDIKADYRDPFLGKEPRKAASKRVTAVAKVSAWDEVLVFYTGSLQNAQTGSRMYFVNIDGTDYILRKGQAQNGITLVAGNDDRITLKYKGRNKQFKRQQ